MAGFSQIGDMSLCSINWRLSVPPLVVLEGQRCGSVGGGGLEVGLRDTVSQCSASLRIPYCPGFVLSPVQGRGLEEEIQAIFCKGAVEPAPPSVGFYSRLLVVTKAAGGCSPIIDLSTLNPLVVKTQFWMETAQPVLRSVQKIDWDGLH